MWARRTAICVAFLCSVLATEALGRQSDLGVGLYMPSLPQGRSDRVRAIERLASFLAAQTGLEVQGLSFAKQADLEAAAARGSVHYAVVSAQYAGGSRRTPTAMLLRGGSTMQPFVFVSRSKVRLLELKGQPVAIVRMGRIHRQFVANVLLEGELDASYFRWVPVPDTASAMHAVRLGKVSAAVVPQSADTTGLVSVFVSIPVPLAGIVRMARTPESVHRKLKAALGGWQGTWLGFDGWRLITSRAFASVRSRLVAGRKAKKPVASKPEPFRGLDRRVLASPPLVLEVPSPVPLLTLPTAKPDAEALTGVW